MVGGPSPTEGDTADCLWPMSKGWWWKAKAARTAEKPKQDEDHDARENAEARADKASACEETMTELAARRHEGMGRGKTTGGERRGARGGEGGGEGRGGKARRGETRQRQRGRPRQVHSTALMRGPEPQRLWNLQW
jgi:hypothetical protein